MTLEGAGSTQGGDDDRDLPLPTTVLEPADAWQTLEALRLGVVPARGVREYTVAREKELASVQELLDQRHGCRVIWGDYGTGKTHLLDAAQQLALEQGFATARLTLDPREQALHHPLRLYRHIAESIRTSDRTSAGFETLFERLADSPDHSLWGGPQCSRFFSPYLYALRHGEEDCIGWLRDYVRGDNIDSYEVNKVLARMGWPGPRALRMPDFRTFGRMYVHLVGTLASWCADAGSKGLVLLFDEVERVDALAKNDQAYAFEVLRHYAAVTIEPEDLAFDPEELYKGGHAVHREIPLRFRDDQPLSTIFALTPLEEIEESFGGVTASDRYDLRLASLRRSDLPPLITRIAAIFRQAYPDCEVAPEVRERIIEQVADHLEEGHDSFRSAVRAAVFLLDAERFGAGQDEGFIDQSDW